MISDVARQAVVLGGALAAGVAACVISSPLTGADPLLIMEVACGAIAAAWAVIASANLVRAWRLGRELRRWSEQRSIDGIRVQVVVGGGTMAMAVGTVTPQIFIGDDLLDILTGSERAAVLWHEEHHRVTRAPVRAAALEAWLTLLGRWGPARKRLIDRLADLEQLADEYAITRGSSAASLAGALLKTEPTLLGASFSYGAERRIHALVDTDLGHPPRARLPYEWLPLTAVFVMSVACHLWGLPT